MLAVTRWRVVALAVASVNAGFIEAALLALIAAIATTLSAGQTQVDVDLGLVRIDQSLAFLFVLGFVLATLRAIVQVAMAYLPAVMSAEVMANLRRKVFDDFTGTSWGVQASERDGHFQSLINKHVTAVSQGVVTLSQGMTAFFMFFTLLAAAISLSVETALALLALSSMLFVVLRPLSLRTRYYAKLLSDEMMEYSKGVQEVVRLAEETQVFGASKSYMDKMHAQIDEVRLPLSRSRFFVRLAPVMYQSVAMFVVLAALLFVSRLDPAQLTSLTAVVLILVRSMTYGQQLQASVSNIYEMTPFVERLREAVDNYRSRPRQDGDQPMPPVRTIAMSDVHYRYEPDVPVLDGLSFEVHAGEAIGVVGPSGAGKSTLVQLLLRLRDPDAGALLVSGQDARTIRRADWQRAVSYVPQSPLLLWGTVTDNIRFHRPELSDDDIERAARLAAIHDDILTWPQGYDTIVGERASAVSGGQRQRLCLARSLAGRPSVLILDEPTSALDVRSEVLVQDALRTIAGETTLFMVAHRLSTLSICDRVMVMVDGRLQAIDTPQRLLETNEFYREAIEITREQTLA